MTSLAREILAKPSRVIHVKRIKDVLLAKDIKSCTSYMLQKSRSTSKRKVRILMGRTWSKIFLNSVVGKVIPVSSGPNVANSGFGCFVNHRIAEKNSYAGQGTRWISNGFPTPTPC